MQYFLGNYKLNPRCTSCLGLLGRTPAGTALFATLLRTALGRTPGCLLLATLLGRGLPARGTSLGSHGSTDWRLRVRDSCCELRNRERHAHKEHKFNHIFLLRGHSHINVPKYFTSHQNARPCAVRPVEYSFMHPCYMNGPQTTEDCANGTQYQQRLQHNGCDRSAGRFCRICVGRDLRSQWRGPG